MFVCVLFVATLLTLITTRTFEADWDAAIDNKVPGQECTRVGLPCSLHPALCPVTKPKEGEKAVRASMCSARDTIKMQFQQAFKDQLGIR